MAFLLVLTAVAAIIFYNLFNAYRKLARNYTEARRSGLPVVVTPWNYFHTFWLATYYMWLPALQRLPKFCQGLWIDIADPEWAYRVGYAPFAKLGSDIFFSVGPSKINLFVADAEVITQMTTRRNDFPKPLEMYKSLDIYGKNLVSTEGSDWRMHRKLTAPSFGEKNNELVFNESLHHGQSLLGLWTGPDRRGNKTISNPAMDTMRFALYIISRAGFDVRVTWPHEEKENSVQENDDATSSFAGSIPPEGHTMNYREALSSLLENIMWTQILSVKSLKRSPVATHREVGNAVLEWGDYMEKLYTLKKSEVLSGQHSAKGGMDLFHTMIEGSGITDSSKKTDLSKDDLLGNAFVIMLAGHETTANAIHYSLIYLAMHWQSQKRLQEDVDRSIAGKSISDWKYDELFPRLFSGMPAAVMHETLRILQPIINIPKSTAPGRPQSISIDGKEHLIPGNTHIRLCCAVHKNPKYWPGPSDQEKAMPNDFWDARPDTERFRPERWLLDPKAKSVSESFVDIKYDDEELRGPSGEDTSSQLFKPVKGSYIPFSDGFRSCIGRRFAQVEILAVFAVIFSHYSVELAVDEWASDEEVEKMSPTERENVWCKARDKADFSLRHKMASIITLQLRGSSIPIRLVRRGEEKFIST